MSKSFLSPLRYPGSKRWLVNYIILAIKSNNLKPRLFIEPFVGGGSVALQLMQGRLVEKVILIDADPWITSFWDVLFYDTDWLIDQIKIIPITLENWSKFKRGNPTNKRAQALTCLFLNRTSFSGILENKVGPIGGKRQNSDYKIDCRFPRDTLIERVRNAASNREMIHGIWNCGWDEGIDRIREDQKKGRLPDDGLFFYLDPPFFEKADTLYRYYFREYDHKQLRNFLLTLKDKWILSYDSAKQVELLYKDLLFSRDNGTNSRKLDVRYSVAIMPERKRVSEIIISNLPELPSLDNEEQK